MSSNSREAILVAAKLTAQAHGYSGLNFRDLAAEVGIKAASIYHHFPSKADLGAAVARRYWEDSAAYLETLLAEIQRSGRLPPPISRHVPQGAGERQPHVPVQLHGRRV